MSNELNPEPVPTPDSADDATVGERESMHRDACPHGEFWVEWCGTCLPVTPPADDANRSPVSGGLDEGEREALIEAIQNGDEVAHVERILAARDAAWVERLAAVEGEREALAWAEMLTHQECAAKKHPDWFIDSEHNILCPWCRAEAAEAERATARREAGERIAQAWDEAVRQVANVDPAAIHNPYRSL